MKALCVIPARGGSKRIPRKNIRSFCGKPMIAWSIEAAQRTGLFDRIVVSTDDGEIAAIARQWGAEAPFMRPAELSGDHTPIVPVVRHGLQWAESTGTPVERVCALFATAPLVTPALIRSGHDELVAHPDTEFVFSAARFSFPIFRAIELQPDGMARMFWPENELRRSQDLPTAYHEAGQFFWATRAALLAHDGLYRARSRVVLVPAERVQDIDTEEDWARAEVLAQHLNLTDSSSPAVRRSA